MTIAETVTPKLENHPLSVVYVREVSLKYRGPRRGVSFDAVGSPLKAAAFMRRVLLTGASYVSSSLMLRQNTASPGLSP